MNNNIPLAATATVPYHAMSDRYAHVTTTDILDVLQTDGWKLDDANQARSRIPGKEAHTKHLLRLSHPNVSGRDEGGGVKPQVVVLNSSDGSSSLRMMLGMFRMACANGLITGDTMREFRVGHRGIGLQNKVLAHAATLRDQTAQMLDVVDRWRATPVGAADVQDFAAAAIRLRSPDAIPLFGGWDPTTAERVHHVSGRNFIRPTRTADIEDNLWNVFNRAQESLINGRHRQIKPRQDGGWKASTVRRVTSLTKSVKLNQEIWNLATQMDVALN